MRIREITGAPNKYGWVFELIELDIFYCKFDILFDQASSTRQDFCPGAALEQTAWEP